LTKEAKVDSFINTHVLLGREQKKQLRVCAAYRGTSMAALVRDAVDLYLRLATGPSSARVRLAARYAVGVLPLAADDDGGSSHDGRPGGLWWTSDE
jgi:hypothetical protein